MIPSPFLGSLRQALKRANLWIYLAIPLVLVGLFAEGTSGSARRLAISYASLFLTTLSIGTAHSLVLMVTCRWTEGRTERWQWVVPYYAAVVAIATRIGVEGTAWLHYWLWDTEVADSRDALQPTAYVVSALVVISMLVANNVQARRRAMEKREEEARQEALRSQLAALQARTDPHFLFNSLNTVASLTRSRPELAEATIEDLAELFRASLGNPADGVPLAVELELAQRYLNIERLRLGERLQVSWEVADLDGELALPALIVQPLLENAVYHGIEPRAEGGTLRVHGRRDGADGVLEIDNPLASGGLRPGGNHMALENIRARLAAFYGRDGLLQTAVADDRFHATLRLPARRPS